MELFLFFLIFEAMSGGAITATVAGAAWGIVTETVKAVSEGLGGWYDGRRKRLSASRPGRFWLSVESAVLGLFKSTFTGVRKGAWPGVKKGWATRQSFWKKVFKVARDARQKAASKSKQVVSGAAAGVVSAGAAAGGSDSAEGGNPDGATEGADGAESGQEPEQDGTSEQAGDDEELPELEGDVDAMSIDDMSAEAKGVIPYLKTWDAADGERIVNELQMMASQLLAAADANSKYDTGGGIEVAGLLQSAADSVAGAFERVSSHASDLHQEHDGAVEHLSSGSSEAAQEYVGQH